MPRRAVRGVLAVGLTLALVACAADPSPRPTWAVVSEVVSAASGAPTAGSGAALAEATTSLLAGSAPRSELWQAVPLSDVAEGRALVERRRPPSEAGIVAVRGRAAKPVVVAVPLPGGAGPNERLGSDLFTRSHATALVVAGSESSAAASDAPLRAVTAALGERGLLLVVIEGFTSDATPDSPEIVLQGATERPSDEQLRVGTVLQAAGVATCILVAEQCIDPGVALEKVEGIEAGPVVRVQLAGRLASDAARRDAVWTQLARAIDDV